MRVRGKAVVGVFTYLVVLLPSLSVRIDVDHDPAEVRQVVEELVPTLLRDLVAFRHRQSPRHRDAHLYVQPMAKPAHPQVGDLFHTRHVAGRVADGLERLRVNPVEHPDHDRASRLPDDDENSGRDQETDDGIGQRVAGPDPDGTEEHCEARSTIYPRVVSVGDEGGATNLPPDPDAEDGHRFVPDESNDGGEHHGPEKTDGLRMEKPLGRLIEGEDGAYSYRGDDDQAHQIFDASETVRESPCGSAPDQQEGDAERDCGSCVGEVVDRIGKQSHTVGQDDHDHHLHECREHQADE